MCEGGCKDGTRLPHSLFAPWLLGTQPLLNRPGHDLTYRVGKSSKIGPCDQNVRKHEVVISKGQFCDEGMAFRCRWLQSPALKQMRNLYLGAFMQSITAHCSSEVPKQLEITKNKQTNKNHTPFFSRKKGKEIKLSGS